MRNCHFSLSPDELYPCIEALIELKDALNPESPLVSVIDGLKTKLSEIIANVTKGSHTSEGVQALLHGLVVEFYAISVRVNGKTVSMRELMRMQGLDMIMESDTCEFQTGFTPEIEQIILSIQALPSACTAPLLSEKLYLLSRYTDSLKKAIAAYLQRGGNITAGFYRQGLRREGFFDFILGKKADTLTAGLITDEGFIGLSRAVAALLFMQEHRTPSAHKHPNFEKVKRHLRGRKDCITRNLKRHQALLEVEKQRTTDIFSNVFESYSSRQGVVSYSGGQAGILSGDAQLEMLATMGKRANSAMQIFQEEEALCDTLEQGFSVLFQDSAEPRDQKDISGSMDVEPRPGVLMDRINIFELPADSWNEVQSKLVSVYQAFLELRVSKKAIVSIKPPEGQSEIITAHLLRWSNELASIPTTASGKYEWARNTSFNGAPLLPAGSDFSEDSIKQALAENIMRDPLNPSKKEQALLEYLASKAAGQNNVRVIEALFDGVNIRFNQHIFDSTTRQYGGYDWRVQEAGGGRQKKLLLKISSTVTAFYKKKLGLADQLLKQIIYMGRKGKFLEQDPMEADGCEYNEIVGQNSIQLPPIFTVIAEIDIEFKNSRVHPRLKQFSIIAHQEGMRVSGIDHLWTVDFFSPTLPREAVIGIKSMSATLPEIQKTQRARWLMKSLPRTQNITLPVDHPVIFSDTGRGGIEGLQVNIWAQAMHHQNSRLSGKNEWGRDVQWDGKSLLPLQSVYTERNIEAALRQKILEKLQVLNPSAIALDDRNEAMLEYLRSKSCGKNSNISVIESLFRDFPLRVAGELFSAITKVDDSLSWSVSIDERKNDKNHLIFNAHLSVSLKVMNDTEGERIAYCMGAENTPTTARFNGARGFVYANTNSSKLKPLFTMEVHLTLDYDSMSAMVTPRVKCFSIQAHTSGIEIRVPHSLLRQKRPSSASVYPPDANRVASKECGVQTGTVANLSKLFGGSHRRSSQALAPPENDSNAASPVASPHS